jgi:hypothetical protein
MFCKQTAAPRGSLRRLWLLLALTVVFVPNAFGTPQLCSSFTNLQNYLDAGSVGCKLGDKVVSDFAFLFEGGTSSSGFQAPIVPPANAVGVTTSLADGTDRPAWVSLSFNFNGAASVAANQTMNLTIQYVVTAPPLATITEVYASGMGARRTQSTTSSRAYLTTDVCQGGPFDVAGTAPTGSCLGSTVSPILTSADYGKIDTSLNPNVVANQRTISASATGLDQTQVGLYANIQLMGGSTDSPLTASQAAASTLTQTFYESYDSNYNVTPEPVPLVLVGSAFVGLGLWRRRKFCR